MPYSVLTPNVFLHSVWPLPRSLATTSGISVDFFSSPYLDVSVQVVTFIYLCIQYMMTGLIQPGFPIRKSTDQCLLSTPRGLSQIAASFVGSWCQGILLAPFVAWPSFESFGSFLVKKHSTIISNNCSCYPKLIITFLLLHINSLFSFQGAFLFLRFTP